MLFVPDPVSTGDHPPPEHPAGHVQEGRGLAGQSPAGRPGGGGGRGGRANQEHGGGSSGAHVRPGQLLGRLAPDALAPPHHLRRHPGGGHGTQPGLLHHDARSAQ